MTSEGESLWRILLVEDEEAIARTTAEALERRAVSGKGERAMVERIGTFDEALGLIEERKYDLIILDIRDQAAADVETPTGDDTGDDALEADRGLHLYSEIRQRRFVPIVFYSAVAHLAWSKNDPPFVTVVSKLENGDELLRQKVTAVFDSQLPQLNRALAQHVDGVLRDFMIEFVEENWTELAGSQHRADLAYLMVRRLARALDATFVADLAGVSDRPASDKVHPTRLYIMPPLADAATGDLYRGPSGAMFILLTPTCDLVDRSADHSGKRNADYVTMAACLPLSGTAEYKAWLDAGQPGSHKNLDALIRNNRKNQPERFYFLPAAWGTPDLLVDLQRISSFPYAEFAEFERVATLDDPYAESVVAQLGRFSGRVGTPDVDPAAVKDRLKQAYLSRQEAGPDAAPTAAAQAEAPTTAQADSL